MDTAEIAEIVEVVLKKRFKDEISIISMDVEHDVDMDGDPILRVKVVFEADTDYVPASYTKGLIRNLRPMLSKKGEEAFPIMSFIAANELEARAAG